MIGYIIVAGFILTIAFLAKREWDWRKNLEARYGDFLIKNWQDTSDPTTLAVKENLRAFARKAVREKAYEVEEIMRRAKYTGEPTNMATL
jgi:hypothetical protein